MRAAVAHPVRLAALRRDSLSLSLSLTLPPSLLFFVCVGG